MTSIERNTLLTGIDSMIASLVVQRAFIESLAVVDEAPPQDPPVYIDPPTPPDLDGPAISLVSNASPYVELEFTADPAANHVTIVSRLVGSSEWTPTNITDSPVSSAPCSVSVNHGYAVGDEVEFAASVRVTLNNYQTLGPVLAVIIA